MSRRLWPSFWFYSLCCSRPPYSSLKGVGPGFSIAWQVRCCCSPGLSGQSTLPLDFSRCPRCAVVSLLQDSALDGSAFEDVAGSAVVCCSGAPLGPVLCFRLERYQRPGFVGLIRHQKPANRGPTPLPCPGARRCGSRHGSAILSGSPSWASRFLGTLFPVLEYKRAQLPRCQYPRLAGFRLNFAVAHCLVPSGGGGR